MDRHAIDRTADAERYDRVSGGFDAPLFDAAAIDPRAHVLDIGCGYGSTTREAARRARDGHALGNDVVEPMLERARGFAEAEGLRNVTFAAGDAQVHPFRAAAFDVAISRFGVMFLADPVAAFAHIGRALRPGGRLVFTTVGPPERNDLPTVLAAASPRRAAPAGPAVRDVHALADPDHLTGVLTRAGFRHVTVDRVETTVALGPGAEAAADFLLSWGAFADMVDQADPAALAAARAGLTGAARRFENGDGVVALRSSAWLARAVSPGLR
ncbi:class I SAM-dependent methyltransferase [Streptomyces sp. NPDC053755]|uniref:class I SAM-dependent methyltransferase n=1 Tax=Streptomyces sp. NPDC053755 TaxID=3155815 RepID=UPI00343BEFA7